MEKKTQAFKTEVQDLLNLVIHSLYSHKDIFLRELLSNSSDAIDKARFEALSDKSLLEENPVWKIKLDVDTEAKTLIIEDNGIGMNIEDLENNLGTIAKSGTKAFMEKIKDAKDATELIGQFGVGFYSAFMVADKVTVDTRRADSDVSYKWTSAGAGEFTIEEGTRTSRGTTITLHLNEESQDFSEEHKLRSTVKQYSDFLAYPVVMDVTRDEYPKKEDGTPDYEADPEKVIEEQTFNSMKAIWTRSKGDITEEEHKEFYSHISHDWNAPAETIHYTAEGTSEFTSLLYLPEKAPMDMFNPQENKGVHLYVKRVFIMDDCKKLLPEYMRFVRGVVDSSDLPLNVSREILQEDRGLDKIKKSLTSKVLSTLKSMKKKKTEKYETFFREFGAILKEGVHSDMGNKEKIQDLLLFESTFTENGKFTTLADYVSRMPEEQKEIYFISGPGRAALETSAHMEYFTKKGYEVIFMTDPIDEWVVQSVTEYDSKPLKSVVKGQLEEDAEISEDDKAPLEVIQKLLDNSVKEVRFTSRLTDSACCLVADEHAMSAHMERMYKAMGQDMPASKRILELNKDHALVKLVVDLAKSDQESAQLKDYSELILDQALLTEGSPIANPSAFARRMADLMVIEAEKANA